MSKKNKLIIVCGSVLLAVAMIVAAWMLTRPKQSGSQSIAASLRAIPKAELTAADGKDGHPCYVALEGEVYEIKNSIYWKQGEHVPSEGQAFCAADLTQMIGKSPHGKTILSRMTKIGRLAE